MPGASGAQPEPHPSKMASLRTRAACEKDTTCEKCATRSVCLVHLVYLVSSVSLVFLVHLVSLVFLVSLVIRFWQPDRPDRPLHETDHLVLPVPHVSPTCVPPVSHVQTSPISLSLPSPRQLVFDESIMPSVGWGIWGNGARHLLHYQDMENIPICR